MRELSTLTLFTLTLVCFLTPLVRAATEASTPTNPTKLQGKCLIPPPYIFITEGWTNRFKITIENFEEKGTYTPGQFVNVIVTQLADTQVIDFILWFEVETGVNKGRRVGAWTVSSVTPPRTKLFPCSGPLAVDSQATKATIVNERPIGNPYFSNDMNLPWQAPPVDMGSLILRGTIVRQLKTQNNRYGYSVFVRVNPASLTADGETDTGGTGCTSAPTDVGIPFASAAHAAFFGPRGNCDGLSPIILPLFQVPFRVPPTAVPSIARSCDDQGRCFTFYDLDIAINPVQLFPTGPPTEFFSYGQNGVFNTPGPTIKTCQAEQVIARFHNTIPNGISVHLHGSASFAPYDGWADDVTNTTEFKDYVYPANEVGTLWYHDHAFSITATNALHGLYAQFWVQPCCRDFTGILPNEAFDFPLVLSDAVFDANNQILFNINEVGNNYLGDNEFVNGVPWPLLQAEPRVYRFRGLTSGVSRVYSLSFQADPGVKIPFYVIASDDGFLQKPVLIDTLLQSIAERYEILLDLRGFEGKSVFLVNEQVFGLRFFCQTHVLMKIDVNLPLSAIPDVTWTTQAEILGTFLTPNGELPLQNIVSAADREAAAALEFGQFDRQIEFLRNGGQWKIAVTPPIAQVIANPLLSPEGPFTWAETFDLPQPHVVADPATNLLEVWEIVNGGGGWNHPVHVHLISGIIVARADEPLPPYEQNAPKDVFELPPGGKLRMLARYGPHSGSFMFHCHNLAHEDNDMLVAMGPQADHPVIRQVGDNIFQDEGFLHIPVSPVNSVNNFANSLRNPMLPTLRGQPEPPLLDPAATVAREQAAAAYFVFYPPLDRVNADGTAPPIGQNPENPYEVDYTCLRNVPGFFGNPGVPPV